MSERNCRTPTTDTRSCGPRNPAAAPWGTLSQGRQHAGPPNQEALEIKHRLAVLPCDKE